MPSPDAPGEGLANRTVTVRAHPESVSIDPSDDPKRLARLLGFEDVAISTYAKEQASDARHVRSFNLNDDVKGGVEDEHESVSTISLIDSLTSDVPAEISGRVRRSVERMTRVRAALGVNIHCAPTAGIAQENQEVVPCLIPGRTPQLSSDSLVHLIAATAPELRSSPILYLSGATAFHDSGVEQRNAHEVILNTVLRHLGTTPQLGELSYLAQGGREGSSPAVRPKTEIEVPNTVLIQAAVYAPIQNEREEPQVIQLHGNITPQAIGQLANQLGFEGNPMAYQLFLSGAHEARAIHSFPNRTYEKIQDAVPELFSDVSWEGHAVASGVRFDTPYSRNGHLHMMSPDGNHGGHWVGTKGEALLVLQPLPQVTTALFDPTRAEVRIAQA